MGLEKVAISLAKYAEKSGVKSILQTKPIKPSAIDALNFSELKFKPLIGDTFERVAKQPTQAEIHNFKLTMLTDTITNRKIDFTKSLLETAVIKKINPIDSTNINEVKNHLLSLVSNSKFKKDISECGDADELLALIKYNGEMIKNPFNEEFIEGAKKEILPWLDEGSLKRKITECTDPEDLISIIEENMSIITKKVPAELLETSPEEKKFLLERTQKLNKLYNCLSPKSQNPIVIQLENDFKALGVKEVNFSDDIVQAQSLKQNIQRLIEEGIQIPNSIIISRGLPFHNSGCVLNLANERKMFLGTTADFELKNQKLKIETNLTKQAETFKKAPPELQETYLDSIRKDYIEFNAGSKIESDFFHEMGHLFQKELPVDENDLKIASQISKYAVSKDNGIEIVPEMFVELMQNKKLTNEQMELYLRLGGIIPNSMKQHYPQFV